jgi:hypothetical protein
VERVVHVSHSFEDARSWDIEQHRSMTPEQRQRAARLLKERVYGRDALDVRASERAK